MVADYITLQLVTFVLPFALFAILGLALNLQWGHTGLFNAGLAGFFAIGAYTTAIIITMDRPRTPIYPGHLGGFSEVLVSVGIPPYLHFAVGLIAAFLLAALVGFLVGLPTLKLRADYLAITTLAVAEIFRLVLTNARPLTAGTIGIVTIPRPSGGVVEEALVDFFGGRTGPASDTWLAILFVVAIVVTFLLLSYLTRAQWGRVLRSVREDEEASTVLGKDTFRFKLQAFTIGCGIMGAAGAFIAIFNRFLVPELFVPITTFNIYVVVLLGGAGNNKGVLLGAAAFFFFDWATIRLKDLAIFAPVADNIAFYRLMAIGLLLILLVMFRPQGLLPEEKYVPKEA